MCFGWRSLPTAPQNLSIIMLFMKTSHWWKFPSLWPFLLPEVHLFLITQKPWLLPSNDLWFHVVVVPPPKKIPSSDAPEVITWKDEVKTCCKLHGRSKEVVTSSWPALPSRAGLILSRPVSAGLALGRYVATHQAVIYWPALKSSGRTTNWG